MTNTKENLEVVVIGSLIDDWKNYEAVKDIIRPEMFENEFFKRIAKYLKKRFENEEPWDALIIADSVPERAGEVYKLASEAPMNEIFFEHLKIFHIRNFWRTVNNELYDPHEANIEAVRRFIDEYSSISSDSLERSLEDIGAVVCDMVANAGMKDIEMPTPYKQLNRFIGGFHRKQIILIVGATGHSKSLFAWNMLVVALLSGVKVMVYDYEMVEESLIIRLVAMHYKIPLDWMQHGYHHTDGQKITDEERTEAITFMAAIVDRVKSNLIIKTHAKIEQVEADFAREKPDIVLFDTIQAFCKKHQKPNGVNNADHITDICSKINRMAKEHNVAILQTAQVNRATDGAIPGEANIKESSGIADNAAVIIGVRDREKVSENAEDSDVFDLGISKNRHGRIGKLTYKINKSIALVGEYEKPKSIEEERKITI